MTEAKPSECDRAIAQNLVQITATKSLLNLPEAALEQVIFGIVTTGLLEERLHISINSFASLIINYLDNYLRAKLAFYPLACGIKAKSREYCRFVSLTFIYKV